MNCNCVHCCAETCPELGNIVPTKEELFMIHIGRICEERASMASNLIGPAIVDTVTHITQSIGPQGVIDVIAVIFAMAKFNADAYGKASDDTQRMMSN